MYVYLVQLGSYSSLINRICGIVWSYDFPITIWELPEDGHRKWPKHIKVMKQLGNAEGVVQAVFIVCMHMSVTSFLSVTGNSSDDLNTHLI